MDSSNLENLVYEHLDCQNNAFTAEAFEKLMALLTIRKEGNVIYICHPSHLFKVMIEEPDTKKIRYVDFDSIDVEKMIRLNDFGCYSIVEQMC